LTRPPRWAAITFAAALCARLAFLLLADQPLLYTHQYHYFTNALRLALHPHPVEYVVFHDDWRTWNGHWTIAPLYHLFAGAVLRVFGLHLLALRLVQCALDALAAVGVAWLGRRAAGRRGWWAGIAYALYWPAVEMPTWTMTENLHTVLLVGGTALLARATERGTLRGYIGAGVVLGLSALTRSVGTGFIVLAGGLLAARALMAARRAGAMAWKPVLAPLLGLALGSAAIVLPFSARNVFIMHEPVLIETAAFENIWFANNFGDAQQFARQQEVVHNQPTPAAKRAAALHFALRGIRRHPERFADKVRLMFWHFLRPEGLHGMLRAERSQEPWRDWGTLLLDDVLLLAMLPPFVAYLVAGRPGAARAVTTLWIAYYLLMVVVIFHNEIRYRSAFVPFGFAGAAGGLAVLSDPSRGRRARIALGAGVLLVAAVVWPYAAPAWRALAAGPAIRAAEAAAASGDVSRAFAEAERAAARDPLSSRPWMDLGRALARAERPAAALAAYERALPLASPANWRATVARPRLLAAAGRLDEAEAALRAAHRLSWDADPWLVLEVAWRELPPPRTDVVMVGGQDYGAVRGFLHPRLQGVEGTHRGEFNLYDDPAGPQPPPGRHRWTRGRAWLRLRPAQPASAYDVTLYMGAPFPSPLESPRVTVRATGAPPRTFHLAPAIGAYTVRAAPAAGQPIEIEIEAPTWNRIGEPAEQGVRVDRLEARPARG
jgi:4-amino-4-deoxy-L-arabinose transferase-like glycosyltransferase